MNRAIDFLYITEPEILSLNQKPPEIKACIQKFMNRNLPKRSLVISNDTVNKPNCEGYIKFRDLEEDPEKLVILNDQFLNALRGKYQKHEVYIDIPKSITFGDSSQAEIQDPTDRKPKFLRDYFKIEDWSSAYTIYKWRAHVFSVATREARLEIGKEFADFIGGHEEYKFSIKLRKARALAKIR